MQTYQKQVEKADRAFRGLTAEEAAESQREHGPNLLPTVKVRGFFPRFLKNLGDPVIRILLCALLLNLIFLLQ